jgi:hypothetical protein
MNPRKTRSPYCLCGDHVQPGSHTCQRRGCAEMWQRITERRPETGRVPEPDPEVAHGATANR